MGSTDDIGEIGYKGYLLYDELEIELSKKYFGTNFKDDELGTDGYAYAYLLNQKGIPRSEIKEYYAEGKEELDVEIKAAFERDVRSSKIDIVTTDGIRILEVSEFNRDFTISYEQILEERSKIKGTNSGDDTNLNAVFAEHNGSRIMSTTELMQRKTHTLLTVIGLRTLPWELMCRKMLVQLRKYT